MQRDGKQSSLLIAFNCQHGARKNLLYGLIQILGVSNLDDGLQRSRQIATIMTQNRGPYAHLWMAAPKSDFSPEEIGAPVLMARITSL